MDGGDQPAGGGVFVKSPDGQALFRLYGYAQPTFTYTDEDNGLAFEQTDFRVRRARLDFAADYQERYKLFVELDGAPADGTALVEAYVQAAYVKDRHYLRFGKFITPFSTENLRSSRALDTVERYLALNAAFSLPALDVQFGPMLWGYLDRGKKVSYYLGVWNGNSSAGAAVVSGQRGNARDNNGDKEVQGRLNVKWSDALTTGAAFDSDREEEQTLTLASYSGGRFIGLTVRGQRRGVRPRRPLEAAAGSPSTPSGSPSTSATATPSSAAATRRRPSGRGGARRRAASSPCCGPRWPSSRATPCGRSTAARSPPSPPAPTSGSTAGRAGRSTSSASISTAAATAPFKAGSGWRPTVLNQLQIKF